MIEKIKNLIKNKLDEFNQLDIGWNNRPYDFYLIFGQNEESQSPWIKSNWENNFEPYFDELIKQTEVSTSHQLIRYFMSTFFRYIPFENKSVAELCTYF